MEICRFAPSTTGPAHPGTLLAALLCWLDARARGARLVLRLEDLDPQRCKPQWEHSMVEDLGWLGFDWDAVERQSDRRAAHEAALDTLERAGLLYPCGVSRAELHALGRRAPDDGWAYDNRSRARELPSGGWRACEEPVRVRLPDGRLELADESGLDLGQDPAAEMGDPVVVRRDGSVAYNIACVVDDNASGVTRVVRGRDIAPSTATQVLLYGLLGLTPPVYRHHLLLLEPRGDKLAKFHGAVGAPELRQHYSAPVLCGLLAHVAGLSEQGTQCTPRQLQGTFNWARVRGENRVLHWAENHLIIDGYE